MEEEERLDRFDNVQDGDRIGVRGVAGNSDSNASSDTPTFPPKRSVRIAEGAVRSDNRLALCILLSYQIFILIFHSIAISWIFFITFSLRKFGQILHDNTDL